MRLRGAWVLLVVVLMPLVSSAHGQEDCAKSLACTREGVCSAASGVCMAAWSVDCEPSAACLEDGKCTARDGRCVAASDADCARSAACRNDGRCRVAAGQCVQDCRTSAACREFGLCTRRGNKCVAASDADCRRSRLCRHEFCTASHGRCYRHLRPSPRSSRHFPTRENGISAARITLIVIGAVASAALFTVPLFAGFAGGRSP